MADSRVKKSRQKVSYVKLDITEFLWEYAINKDHISEWVTKLAECLANQDPNMEFPFGQKMLEEARGFGQKQSENARMRWNKNAMPDDATALPEHANAMPDDATALPEHANVMRNDAHNKALHNNTEIHNTPPNPQNGESEHHDQYDNEASSQGASSECIHRNASNSGDHISKGSNANDLTTDRSFNGRVVSNDASEHKRPRSRGRDSSQEEMTSFEAFWTLYPRKQAKQAAEQAWMRRVKAGNPPDIGKVISALNWQMCTPEWCKDRGQYIPMPTTYINQGRWDDERPYQQSKSNPPTAPQNSGTQNPSPAHQPTADLTLDWSFLGKPAVPQYDPIAAKHLKDIIDAQNKELGIEPRRATA